MPSVHKHQKILFVCPVPTVFSANKWHKVAATMKHLQTQIASELFGNPRKVHPPDGRQ